MHPELTRLLDRMTAQRVAAWQALRAGAAPRPSSTDAGGDAFRVGARVFDTVSGEEGEVAGRTTENVVIPAPAKRVG